LLSVKRLSLSEAESQLRQFKWGQKVIALLFESRISTTRVSQNDKPSAFPHTLLTVSGKSELTVSSASPPTTLIRLCYVKKGSSDVALIRARSKDEVSHLQFDKIPKPQNPKPVPSF